MSLITADGYDSSEQAKEFALWSAAAVVVCALHVGLALGYLLLKPEPEARAEAPAFDVAFMPATDGRPATLSQPVEEPPAQKMDQASQDPPPETPPPQQAVPEAEPPPARVEAMLPPEPVPPPVALSPPEAVVEPKAPDEVAVLPPVVKPAEVLPPPEKPVPIPEPVRKPPHEEKAETRMQPPKVVPPKAAESKPARLAMAPNRGVESDGARDGRASWLSEVTAHLRRYLVYPQGSTESGTARVSFTLDRSGRLRSRRVVASSGAAVLDRAALDIVERAQPYPPFPASITQATQEITVPLLLRPR